MEKKCKNKGTNSLSKDKSPKPKRTQVSVQKKTQNGKEQNKLSEQENTEKKTIKKSSKSYQPLQFNSKSTSVVEAGNTTPITDTSPHSSEMNSPNPQPTTPLKNTSEDFISQNPQPATPLKSTSENLLSPNSQPVTPRNLFKRSQVLSPGPSPKSPRYQSTDIHGYIVSVTSSVSKSGNQFIDVLVKTTETENEIIRIMRNSNSNITVGLLTSYKLSSQPVEFTNLSPSNTGIYFFNSFRGSKVQASNHVTFAYDSSARTSIKDVLSHTIGTFNVVGSIKWLKESAMVKTANGEKPLREAILYDNSGDVKFTVWDELITSIQEETQYNFTNLCLKNYFGKKLSTTKLTSFTVNESDPSPTLNPKKVQEYQSKEQTKVDLKSKLCCPEIKNLELELFPGCTNRDCLKPVVLQPGIKIVTCPNCNHTMRADRCDVIFHCKLSFEECTLTLPKDVLESFLSLDIIKLGRENIDELKEKVLFLEEVDYTYNKKNIIILIENH